MVLFAKTNKTNKGTLDDIVSRSGRDIYVVLAAIAATLISPPIAILGAALVYLHSGSKNHTYGKPAAYPDKPKLRDLLGEAVSRHSYNIKRKLIDYGFKEPDADRFVHEAVYSGYLDGLLTAR
ncbi:MAG TPA: hypothetical protein VJI52_03755 [Candidatus Nanoarchaeia archaeon]|nr:hypothetical protein [Candidatus Nanoarchaeia archaeon]